MIFIHFSFFTRRVRFHGNVEEGQLWLDLAAGGNGLMQFFCAAARTVCITGAVNRGGSNDAHLAAVALNNWKKVLL